MNFSRFSRFSKFFLLLIVSSIFLINECEADLRKTTLEELDTKVNILNFGLTTFTSQTMRISIDVEDIKKSFTDFKLNLSLINEKTNINDKIERNPIYEYENKINIENSDNIYKYIDDKFQDLESELREKIYKKEKEEIINENNNINEAWKDKLLKELKELKELNELNQPQQSSIFPFNTISYGSINEEGFIITSRTHTNNFLTSKIREGYYKIDFKDTFDSEMPFLFILPRNENQDNKNKFHSFFYSKDEEIDSAIIISFINIEELPENCEFNFFAFL